MFCFKSQNEIYVSDHSKHCIILFDLNLNQLKHFGSEGVGSNQLNYPLGLSCHGDYLYICDRDNKRIQIFSLDFEYVNTIQLNGLKPYRTELSNTTIVVSCNGVFYDFVSKDLKFKYNIAGTNNINYFYSTFYALNVKQEKIYFFDSDGNFLEEKAFHEQLILSSNWVSGSMCRYKDQLYMTDYNSGKVFKFLE